METLTAIASAAAKVNLVLRCGGPDEEGYHPLVTVFESLSLREYVVAEKGRSECSSGLRTLVYRVPSSGGEPQFSKSATDHFAPLDDEQHLAYRAAAALGARVGVDVTLTVHKTIPVAGGMAGGSADAAATLVAVNELLGLGRSKEELLKVGATLGADVPACIVGGIALGTGRGDQMRLFDTGTEKPAADSHWWVLAFADEGLSTPAVFRTFDRMNPNRPTLEEGRLVSQIDRDFGRTLSASRLAPLLVNDLESPALELRPDLATVGSALLEAGALAWTVSGSGPTVAGLAAGKEEAGKLAVAVAHVRGVSGTAVAWGPTLGARIERALPRWAVIL